MPENNSEMGSIVDFLFEVGILAKTPRSGFHLLGSGEQSVAEHINRVTFIGFTLGMMNPALDIGKILKMCLVHDLHESRISDLNYVHQKYTERDENKALHDLAKTLPFGEELVELVEEYEKRESMEARIAKDADRLEWLMALKEQYDTGNSKAAEWMETAIKRMDTDIAKLLAEKIIKTESDHWWAANKNDAWWVHRDKSSL